MIAKAKNEKVQTLLSHTRSLSPILGDKLLVIPTEFRQRIRDLEKILIIFQSALGHIEGKFHGVDCVTLGPHPYLRYERRSLASN